MKRFVPVPVLVLVFAVAACSKSDEKPGAKDIGGQAADIVSDTEVLRLANAAAEPVVRAAGDCETVRSVMGEAQRKLDELDSRVRTVTGKTTLDAVRKRVSDITETCG